ncbi:MAG: hypothetical protein L0Y61_04325 [Epsilonproteobacteria bacterium]|nr:hypothetical protein [Campylobacterota bacterium]
MKHKNRDLISEDYFLISINVLDISNIEDFNHEFYQLEYCENSLDIPIHFIEYTSFDGEELEISLKEMSMCTIQNDDDWYFQLKNLAKYSRAS